MQKKIMTAEGFYPVIFSRRSFSPGNDPLINTLLTETLTSSSSLPLQWISGIYQEIHQESFPGYKKSLVSLLQDTANFKFNAFIRTIEKNNTLQSYLKEEYLPNKSIWLYFSRIFPYANSPSSKLRYEELKKIHENGSEIAELSEKIRSLQKKQPADLAELIDLITDFSLCEMRLPENFNTQPFIIMQQQVLEYIKNKKIEEQIDALIKQFTNTDQQLLLNSILSTQSTIRQDIFYLKNGRYEKAKKLLDISTTKKEEIFEAVSLLTFNNYDRTLFEEFFAKNNRQDTFAYLCLNEIVKALEQFKLKIADLKLFHAALTTKSVYMTQLLKAEASEIAQPLRQTDTLLLPAPGHKNLLPVLTKKRSELNELAQKNSNKNIIEYYEKITEIYQLLIGHKNSFLQTRPATQEIEEQLEIMDENIKGILEAISPGFNDFTTAAYKITGFYTRQFQHILNREIKKIEKELPDYIKNTTKPLRDIILQELAAIKIKQEQPENLYAAKREIEDTVYLKYNTLLVENIQKELANKENNKKDLNDISKNSLADYEKKRKEATDFIRGFKKLKDKEFFSLKNNANYYLLLKNAANHFNKVTLNKTKKATIALPHIIAAIQEIETIYKDQRLYALFNRSQQEETISIIEAFEISIKILTEFIIEKWPERTALIIESIERSLSAFAHINPAFPQEKITEIALLLNKEIFKKYPEINRILIKKNPRYETILRKKIAGLGRIYVIKKGSSFYFRRGAMEIPITKNQQELLTVFKYIWKYFSIVGDDFIECYLDNKENINFRVVLAESIGKKTEPEKRFLTKLQEIPLCYDFSTGNAAINKVDLNEYHGTFKAISALFASLEPKTSLVEIEQIRKESPQINIFVKDLQLEKELLASLQNENEHKKNRGNFYMLFFKNVLQSVFGESI